MEFNNLTRNTWNYFRGKKTMHLKHHKQAVLSIVLNKTVNCIQKQDRKTRSMVYTPALYELEDYTRPTYSSTRKPCDDE